MLKKTISVLLALLLTLSVFPVSAFAAETPEIASITNGYLTYTINMATGGFSIKTEDGHPYKQYDNGMPLLYRDDKVNSDETSYVTVRINEKDYVFGRDYGLFGISTVLTGPTVSDAGNLITTVWTIKGFTVTQEVAISKDENNDLTGNVGISYTVQNNSGKAGTVGLRVLLDAALGNSIDAPYVLADNETAPVLTEHEYSAAAGNMPQQLRAVDSVTSVTKASYLFFRGWNNSDTGADRVVVGHWANLANTRYEYTPDAFCDFSNYSNVYRVPDVAYGIYWSEQSLASGGSRKAELLYGVGNFATDTLADQIGIDVICDRVKLNDSKDAYVTNELNVTVNLDNSLDHSVDLSRIQVTILADQVTEADGVTKHDDGIHVVGQSGDAAVLNKGQLKQMQFKLKVDDQDTVTSKRYYVNVEAEDYDGNIVADSVSRYVLVPGLSGKKPTVQFNDVKASIIYTSGKRGVTVSGDVEALRALKGSAGWDLMLVPEAGGDPTIIAQKDITFLEDVTTNPARLYAFSFTTEAELAVGKYVIEFRITDPTLVAGLGFSTLKVGKTIEVSNDKKYATTTYGILAMIRHHSNQYCFVTFTTEQEFQNFYTGKTGADYKGVSVGDEGGKLDAHDYSKNYKKGAAGIADQEMLLIVRGSIMEMTKKVGDDDVLYYQADAKDCPVTINNMMEYTGDTPLKIDCSGNLIGDAATTYGLHGDGVLKVIDSITVWHHEWSITAQKLQKYTLDPAKANGGKQLSVNLEGAAFLIQDVGGFLVDLKYGLLTGDYDDDAGVVHGVSFGGSISIPIKGKKEEEKTADPNADDDDYSFIMEQMFDEEKAAEENLHKDTHFSDGNLSATVDSVLFGEEYDDKEKKVTTGFVGIDTTVELSLPKDVLGDLINNLGGVYAKVVINTLDNYYELSAGLKIKVLECSGTLAFKETEVKGKDVIVPDKIAFYIEDGLKIPIAPPLMMTGLGGGISNLADTIGGEFTKLPPITLNLFTRLSLFNRMIGDFNLTASLSGLDLTGDLKIKDAEKLMSLKAGISARWIDPWHLSMYGEINVIDGLLDGTLQVVIADDLFYGYVCVAVCIPNSIPIVGGKQLAAVEGAVSNKFIGANIKIIGISFGVIYYWSGDFDFGRDIDLSLQSVGSGFDPLNAYAVVPGVTEAGGEYTAAYGTNVHRLAAEDGGLSLQGYTGEKTVSVTGANAYDALLLDFTHNAVVLPQLSDLEFRVSDLNGVNADYTVPLIEDDGNGNGNCLLQALDDGNHIYITVTDPDLLNLYRDGSWTLALKDGATGTLTGVAVSSVDALPELASTSADAASYNTGSNMNVSWTWKDSHKVTDGFVDVYVTKDADAIARAQNGEADALGTRLAHVEATPFLGSEIPVEIPKSFESGDYYVLTMFSSAAFGVTYAMTSSTVSITNVYAPNPVNGAELQPAGNGEFYLKLSNNFSTSEDKNYTDYVIELQPENSSISVSNSVMQWSVGDTIVFGKTMDLIPGERYRAAVRTLRETEDGEFYYGETTVYSDYVTLPEANPPKLLSVVSNITEANTSKDTLEVTYKFDRPVLLTVEVNNEPEVMSQKDANGYVAKDTFTLTRSLDDGDYIVDFTAYDPTTFDSVTGMELYNAGNEDAVLAFTVDTSAPFLCLDQYFVYASATDGKYTLTGVSNVTSTVKASDGTVTRGANGSFTITGTLTGALSKDISVQAADANGNITEVIATVVSADTKIDSIYVKYAEVNGNDAPVLVPEGGDVTIEMFDSKVITVYAKTSTGKEIALSPADVTWEILGERNVVYLNEAADKMYAEAMHTGETAISINFGGGQLSTQALNTGTSSYFYVTVGKSQKSAAPSGLDTKGATGANVADGAIEGTTIEMEYCRDASFADAVTCSKDITENLLPGTYYVRYKATALETYSDYVTLVIPYTEKPVEEENSEHGTVKIERKETEDGSVTTVTITPDDGYVIASVKVNGEKVDIHGKFTLENVPEDTRIDVTFKAKTPLSRWINPYKDVKAGDWFYEAVWYATVSGWVNGVAEDLFAPNANLTRGMFVTMLHRVELVPEAGTSKFEDVAPGSWYEEAVAWANDNGIVKGISDTLYAPNNNITREQMATILYRYANWKGYDVSVTGDPLAGYTDAGQISDYAADAMAWAVSVGLLKGRTTSELAPRDLATRAEAVTVFERVEKLLKG